MVMLFVGVGIASAQQTEYALNLPSTDVYEDGYSTLAQHSGARDVSGPHDLDGDGKHEVIVADYSGGGRVHVIENSGVDTWELVFSTPFLDSTATTNNIRAIAAGDLDGDGFGEIMFLGGRSYGVTTTLVPGLYIFEATGNDTYSETPTIYEFGELPDRWRAEQMHVMDVDGDGIQELMLANNGAANGFDNWYVISVSGDIGSGFEVFTEELRVSSRGTEDYDPVDRGGGSPYGIVPADLDGDGTWEIQIHAWNNFTISNIDVTGADTYKADGAFIKASAFDDVSLFGGVAADINGDGDHEVFYPNLYDDDLIVVNYESGEDVMTISTDQVHYGLIPDVSTLGLTAGDLDGDGVPELIGTGKSYTDGAEAPEFVNVVKFAGGDVEDGANYSVTSIAFPEATGQGFDMILKEDTASGAWEGQGVFAAELELYGGGHGIAVDPDGKIWYQSYYATDSVEVNGVFQPVRVVYVLNPDGTQADFSPVKFAGADTLGGYSTVDANGNPAWEGRSGRGLGVATDGDILVSAWNTIFKLDYKTGEGKASSGNLGSSLTAATSDDNGFVYVGFVLPGFPVKVLDGSDLSEVKNAVESLPSFARTLAVSPDGNTLFVPRYTEHGVRVYQRENPLAAYDSVGMAAKGMDSESMGIHPTTGHLYISAGSPNDAPNRYEGVETNWSASTHYAFSMDDLVAEAQGGDAAVPATSLSWNTSNEADGRNRGLAFSPDGNTAYGSQFSNATEAIQYWTAPEGGVKGLGTYTMLYGTGAQGPDFVSKLAYLGDADGDGYAEVAMAFQGVDDSLYTYRDTFNPADTTFSRTIESVVANPSRVFMRVLQGASGSTSIVDERVVLPSDYVLESNYPNPFNPTTNIRFTLPIDKAVSVRVYDMTGRLVKTLVNQQLLAQGTHTVQWDGTNSFGAQVASGNYIYSLEYGNFRQSKTMVLVK